MYGYLYNRGVLASLFTRYKIIERKVDLYSQVRTSEDIHLHQVNAFNVVWSDCLENIDFYKDWASEHGLPRSIKSIECLKDFPVLTKENIRSNFDTIADQARKRGSRNTVSTGGSSGVPVVFPTSKYETVTQFANTYLGRRWWNIKPFDSIVHIWGHSHLFGSGIKGKLKQAERRIKDALIRTKKLNAYNMTCDQICQHIEEILKVRPEAIIGYTSAIFKIAQFAKQNGIILSHDKLKGVIVTAEAASVSDIELIREVFKAEVILEYGMAETGVIGYSRGETLSNSILWDSFACVELEDGMGLTTLYSRSFPLINYLTGDVLEETKCCNSSILQYKNVSGRQQYSLNIKSESGSCNVSAIVIVHILKSWPGILSVTSSQFSSDSIKVRFSSIDSVAISEIKRFLVDSLSKECSAKVCERSVELILVPSIPMTIAGKEKIYEEGGGS